MADFPVYVNWLGPPLGDANGIRLEIDAAGYRSSLRRSTDRNMRRDGHENVSQGKPAAIAAPIVR